MIDAFLLRALLAGLGVALAAGPLGAFVVWRRMAYFGEAIAHAVLLGVAFSLLLDLRPLLGVLLFSLLLAGLLLLLERQRTLPLDAILGVLAHGALAAGLIMLAFMDWVRVDLMSYLFGDVLAVSTVDLAIVAAMLLLVLAGLARLWRPLVAMTVHEDLARVEGEPVDRARVALTLMLAAVIAVGMKVVGMLLIVSLLIVPAAAARAFARTPEQMAALASLAGCLAVCGGLAASWRYDLPAGPAIAAAAVALFALSLARGATGRGLAG